MDERDFARFELKMSFFLLSIPQHPDYNTFVAYAENDIALVKLATRVNLNNRCVSIAKLAEPGADFKGNECKLTGWGLKDGSGKKMVTRLATHVE